MEKSFQDTAGPADKAGLIEMINRKIKHFFYINQGFSEPLALRRDGIFKSTEIFPNFVV